MSKRLLILTLALALLGAFGASSASAAVTAGSTGWSWANPLPQGYTLTKVETVGGRAYVGGKFGTILRSDDGGSTWTGIRSGLNADIIDLKAISADSIVFATKCALRRTDDGGTTVKRLPWGPSDTGCVSPIVSVSFPTAEIGYLLLQNGDVLTTGDGGDSWKKQTAIPDSPSRGGSQNVSDIKFVSAANGVVGVGNQIYATADSGVSWSLAKTVLGPGLVHFEFISPTEGFAFGNHSSVYKTIDGGTTWNEIASDGSTNNEDIVALSCTDATTCLASIASGSKILRTSNGGTTWSAVTPSTSAVFGVGYTSATHALAVGNAGITVVTEDSGATWTAVNSSAPGKFDSLHVDTPTSALLMGAAGALARSQDSGATWKPLTTLSADFILDAAFPTAKRGYVADSRGALTRSDDGGISWKYLDTGGVRPYALYAPNDQTLLIAANKGVSKSTDGGLTINPTGTGKFRKTGFDRIDVAGSAVIAYSNTAISITTDLGSKWKSIKKPKAVKTVRRIDFLNAKSGYILDFKSELWFTSTGGKKWTRIMTTTDDQARQVAFNDVKHGFLADSSGRVLFTADGGATWATQFPDYAMVLNGGFNPLLATIGAKGAVLAEAVTNTVFSTTSYGQVGVPSTLTIKSSSPKVKKNKTFRITGKLSPAQGGEEVTVLTRAANAKPGTKWKAQIVTVSLGGTFTTTWKISSKTIAIARWAGDGAHDGDGSSAVTVKLKK